MVNVSNEVMVTIVEEEIEQWQASSYRMKIRHRVFSKIGNKPGMEAIEKEMVMIETSIDELRAVLTELNGASGE